MQISSTTNHSTMSLQANNPMGCANGLSSEAEKNELSMDKAARIIQRNVRPFLRRQGVLSSAALPDYKPLCDWDVLEEMPEADGGFTRVCLPVPYPEIVFKACHNSEFRFTLTRIFRKELKEMGCSHLIVPRAIPVNSFLIEERLPITIDSLDNMRLYCSQPELFDEAVREMVKFSSKWDLTSDLLDIRNHPLSRNAEVEGFVRYDNLPLYKVSIDGVEQGRLGLIDLERISAAEPGDSLTSLARLFPLHHDIIREEADGNGIPYDDEALSTAVADGKKYLAVGYADHDRWLQEKNVSNNVEDWKIELSQERMDQLKKIVEKELLSMNEGKTIGRYFARSNGGYRFDDECEVPAGYLKGDAVLAAEKLSDAITQKIIGNFNKVIIENCNKYAQGQSPAELADSNLVKLRTYFNTKDNITRGVQCFFLKSENCNKELFKVTFFLIDGVIMAEKLADALFAELVKGQEIFYYDPINYAGASRYCWIRY